MKPFQVKALDIDPKFQSIVNVFFREATQTLFVGKEKHRVPYSPAHFLNNSKYWQSATEDGTQDAKEVFTDHCIAVDTDFEFQKAWLLVNGLDLPGMETKQGNEYLDYLMYSKLSILPKFLLEDVVYFAQVQEGDRLECFYQGAWFKATFKGYSNEDKDWFQLHCDGDEESMILRIRSSAKNLEKVRLIPSHPQNAQILARVPDAEMLEVLKSWLHE